MPSRRRESPEERLERVRQESAAWIDQEPVEADYSGETEHSHTFLVKVFSYGNPEVTLISQLRELGKHLHHGFGDNFEMFTEDGKTKIDYDHFAHDGEHVGHNETLTFVFLEDETEQ